MSNKIIQNFQNVDCMLTIEQAREHIDELTIDIRGNKSYYRRHYSDDVLSKKEREEILLEEEIQAEIDFYENQIFKAEKYKAEPDNDEERIDSLGHKMVYVQESRSQGDRHEEEIQLLKHQVAKLEGTVDVLVEMVQLLAKRSLSNCECDKVKSRKVEPQEKKVSGKPEEILTYTTRYGPAAKWNEKCVSTHIELSNEDKDEKKMWGYSEGACYVSDGDAYEGEDFSDGDEYKNSCIRYL
jgi:hypothetical protein